MPEKPENKTYVIKNKATLKDTEKNIVRIINAYHHQVSDLSKELTGKNDYETGYNIWLWVKENIKYVPDREKIEELRRPARTIGDGIGDCDCMTILICSLLIENDIEPFLKIVAYPERDDGGNFWNKAKDFVKDKIDDFTPAKKDGSLDTNKGKSIAIPENGKQTSDEISFFKKHKTLIIGGSVVAVIIIIVVVVFAVPSKKEKSNQEKSNQEKSTERNKTKQKIINNKK